MGNKILCGISQRARAWFLDGGPGSGNFGHAGRPGQRGGSGEGGGGGIRAGHSSDPVASSSSSATQAEEEQKTSLEEMFSDLWGAIEENENEREERKREEQAQREAEEKEQKERDSFGQNGMLESEYPAELQLTPRERKYLNENVATFYDEGRRPKKNDTYETGEMYQAAKGGTPLINLELERRNAKQKLAEADEMIAQRIQEGYKGMSREESYQRWQRLKRALAEAGEDERGAILASARIDEKGIMKWRSQRKDALQKLADCDFVEKLMKRAKYAKAGGKSMRDASPRAQRLLRALDAFVPEFEEDGGPGSGNWGHKGRPGQRGGSGKGGGKVMRTGSASTGFSSIKKDPAFHGVREAAKAYTPEAFWNLLQQDPAADKALRDQHAACGTKESLSDYQKRIYNMIHKATQQELAYKEKEAKRIQEQAAEALAKRHHVVDVPKDAITTYRRRPNQFAHEITDVVDQFGLNGKPKLMGREEFDKYRKDHPNDPLFFRAYRARDNAELASFDKMLNEGEWYVDCSNGGAQYGQGMYVAGVYDRTKDYWPGVQAEMRHYSSIWSSSSTVSRTRVMMLDPSARIFTPKLRATAWGGENEIRHQLLDELRKRPDIVKDCGTYDKSDQYLKTPEYKGVVDKEKDRMAMNLESYWQDSQLANTPEEGLRSSKLSTKWPQIKKLHDMPKAERDKMLEGFADEVTQARVRNAAEENAGETAPTVYVQINGQWGFTPTWKRHEDAECGFRKIDMAEIREIAKKHAKTKQMAELLARLYYNSHGPYSGNSYRAKLDFGSIVNETAGGIKRFERMNAGPLAALMGYDAINSFNHGKTESYTVILNRTKLILSEEPVNLHGSWKG